MGKYNGGGIAVLGEVLVNATQLSDSALVGYGFGNLFAPHDRSKALDIRGAAGLLIGLAQELE